GGGGDANPDDEWGSYATAGKKKKKGKGKNADPEPPPPPPPAPPEPTFDDVNLNDGSAPKLDLDFGGADANTKSSSFGGFGAWGGGWGASGAATTTTTTGTSWGFGNTGGSTDTAKAVDTTKASTADDSSWSFGGSKKDKKKKANGGFDFNFLDDGEGEDAPAANSDDKPAEVDDAWGRYTMSGKKKKKGALTDAEPESGPNFGAVVVPEPEPMADDSWNSWSTAEDKKKNKKKDAAEPEPENVDVPPPPPADNDPRGSAPTKKGKKGKKNAQYEEPAVVFVPEPDPIVVVPEVDRPAAADEWGGGMWGMSAKDKKKAKKAGKQGKDEPVIEVVPEPDPVVVVPEPEPAADDEWAGGWGTTNKKKKKKGGATESAPTADDLLVVDVSPVVDVVAKSAADNDWMNSWDTSKDKKNKKKGAVEEIPPPAPPPPPAVPDISPEANDNNWSFGWGTSAKDKKKKGKSTDPEPYPVTVATFGDDTIMVPDSVDEPKTEGEDDWATGWGATSKKKKKGPSKNAPVEVTTESTPAVSVMQPDSITEFKSTAEEGTARGTSWSTGKEKKKGAKGSASDSSPPAAPSPSYQGLDAGLPPPLPLVDTVELPMDDTWKYATTGKMGKKDKKGGPIREASSAKVPTIAESKLGKNNSKESPDEVAEVIGDFAPAVVVVEELKAVKEEPPKTAKSSGWGLFGSSSKTKTTKEKEKERKDKEEKEKKEAAAEAQRKADEEAFAAALGEDPNEIMDIIDEAPLSKKDSKKKGSTPLSKVESKSSKKSSSSKAKEDDTVAVEAAAMVDVVEAPAPSTAAEESKPKKADGWGFWGSSLKSAKKPEPKKEITPDESANRRISLTEPPKMPEVTLAADEVMSATTTSKAPAKTKAAVKGSVAERVKALQERNKIESVTSPLPPPPPPPPSVPVVPEPEPAFLLVDVRGPKASAKDKKSANSSSKKKDKELSPEPLPAVPPVSKAVPGGFPGEDSFDVLDFGVKSSTMPVASDKKSSKTKTSDKKLKDVKSTKADAIIDVPRSKQPDLMDDNTPVVKSRSKLPTPPPDPDVKTESRSAKKERAKVVKDPGASSWGFWGAAPKPEVKKEHKTRDEPASSPTKEKLSAPGLSRSKSARKATDRGITEKSAKSSGSDKHPEAKSTSRPKSSRGLSFSNMFGGGPPPARSASMRHSTSAVPKSGSRRASMDVGAGLMSPPPDDNVLKVSAKAAQVMGIGKRNSLSRSQSTREQGKPRGKMGGHTSQAKFIVTDNGGVGVPDPYAIDDDLVMIDGDDKIPTANAPPPEPLSSRRREMPTRSTSKRDSKAYEPMMSGGLSGADDAVLIDAYTDGAKGVPGPGDRAWHDTPRQAPMKRSASSAKKTAGLMGFFGGFVGKSSDDRHKNKPADESEDGASRRKRASPGYEDDHAKRLRRDGRKVGRSRAPDADGFTAEAAPVFSAADGEDADARRAERRAKRAERDAAVGESRAAELAEAEERAARRREKERAVLEARKAKAREAKERRDREEEEMEARRQEEKRARRAVRAAEEQAGRDVDGRDAERRRRRDKERDEPTSRPQLSDRRKSHLRTPDDRARRDDRHARRTPAERPRTDRRKSAMPVDDYFDPRNGQNGYSDNVHPATAPPEGGRPYLAPGGDKTSSWVNAVNVDPPLPPPVEGTVLDGPGPGLATYDEERTARRNRRKDGEEREKEKEKSRRREDRGMRSSDGSAGEKTIRRRSAMPELDGGRGVRSWDGAPVRPGGEKAAKRGSWFKKIAGL
ncbi:hypothetical protein LTR04_004969, partial [Oleoguttula sp. CCFEE 6159]